MYFVTRTTTGLGTKELGTRQVLNPMSLGRRRVILHSGDGAGCDEGEIERSTTK